MAVINSYATLITAIQDFIGRSDLSGFAPNFLQNCEAKLYKNLRIRTMETALSDTIASGVVAVPSDYVELKYAYINNAPIQWLQRVPPEQIYTEYPTRSGSNTPRYIAREASNFIFGPYPADYAVVGIYYARLTALGAGNTTNWFTSNAPDLLLYGSLVEAEPFMVGDERMVTWKALYNESFAAVANEEKRENRSGSVQRMRVS